ncbi:putative serine/threonine-protein kinase [Apostasia shenzhenica]|uniref:[RNA-polymerase]-subunit kinase n=1 Tax=Apostasia shenzhenica TaxID=1088818 RepID=A0A2I0BG24_9ASPA|nr:putative serine/threonine-protein kinase [Apostasia shenzhenica]
MGCICSKGIETDEIAEDIKKGSGKSLRRLVTPLRKDDADVGDRSIRVWAMPQENAVVPIRTQSDEPEKKGILPSVDRNRVSVGHQRRATVDLRASGTDANLKIFGGVNDVGRASGIFDVPNGFSGEHVAAGWPAWLTNVAAEAVNGWLPRRADSFEKLDKIGQGTYSSVYKACDLETGKIVALKKVRFVNMDAESVRFMAREIHVLRRLNHPNIVKLEGIVTSRMSCNLYLVFEYMDHDLAGLAAIPGIKFTEPQVKCFMQQLLCGLGHCHSRGVLHRDIKGSNLLVDNNGILRIADFGLATFFNSQSKQSLTSRVVTLWYRPPELLLGATEYGVAVDLWGAGCILAELLAGKPIMPGRTEVEQLHKIFKLCGSPPEEYWRKSKLPHATIFKPQHPYPRHLREIFKDFSPSALALLDILLAIQPEDRGTSASALQSEFFTTKPLACDPSSLPKFPPSKEYDTKLRDEEARRQKAALKSKAPESGRIGPVDHKAMYGKDASGDLQGQPNPKSNSEKYNPLEDSGSGFPIDPPGGAPNGLSHANTSLHPSVFGKIDDARMTQNNATSTVRVANAQQLRSQRSCMPQSSGMDFANTRSSMSSRYNRFDVAELSEKPHALDRPSSANKGDEGVGTKNSTIGYGGKNKRIHYSGPLMPPGGNIEELLKEHERQIQQAVRKARLDKVNTKKNF